MQEEMDTEIKNCEAGYHGKYGLEKIFEDLI
jgi:hypothetical protein